MFSKKELTNLLFFDIETISTFKTYLEFSESNPRLAELFDEKMNKVLKDDDKMLSKQDRYFKKSSLYPEFSKILTISYGILKINEETGEYVKHVKNIIDIDESVVLTRFANVVNKMSEIHSNFKLSGHNIEGFDIPFLVKRMMINGITIPQRLQMHNLKPWEFPTLDTMKFWRFGSFEPTSLDVLCLVMGITSPKTTEVNNKLISELYYNGDEDSLTKIHEYCNKDVDAVMNLLIKFSTLG